MSSEELRFRLERASRMGTVSWVFSCSSELQTAERDLKPRVNDAVSHRSSHATECNTLELFGDVIVLGVLQYLRQTGDDVTLNLNWRDRHQLHELGGQLLQEGHRKRSVISSSTQDCKQYLYLMMITTLGSTTLSSHLNWFMMIRGTLRAPSPAL